MKMSYERIEERYEGEAKPPCRVSHETESQSSFETLCFEESETGNDGSAKNNADAGSGNQRWDDAQNFGDFESSTREKGETCFGDFFDDMERRAFREECEVTLEGVEGLGLDDEPAEYPEWDYEPKFPSRHNIEIGSRGEKAAARYLEHVGYEILEMNWTCPFGEADIVAREGNTLVFVEVKTRTSINMGFPIAAIDARKRWRYERIAACFLQDMNVSGIPVRFDAIGLLVIADDRALVRHIRDAFGTL